MYVLVEELSSSSTLPDEAESLSWTTIRTIFSEAPPPFFHQTIHLHFSSYCPQTGLLLLLLFFFSASFSFNSFLASCNFFRISSVQSAESRGPRSSCGFSEFEFFGCKKDKARQKDKKKKICRKNTMRWLICKVCRRHERKICFR